ncbi:MAG: DUF935 family protein [Pseudomonadota bacterium]
MKQDQELMFREIAAAPRSSYLGSFLDELGHGQDSGWNGAERRKILRDETVKACLTQRFDAVISSPWDVQAGGESPADQDAADFVKEQLAGQSFDALTRKMLFGLLNGFAVAEIIWGVQDTRLVIEGIKVRAADRFRFAGDQLLLLTQDAPEGIVMPDRKFWVFAAQGTTDDVPHGTGLGAWLWWPVFFKRNVVSFWAEALERFGSPARVGKYGADAKPEEKDTLMKAARALGRDAAVVIPEGMQVELVEATRRAGGDYHAFCAYMDGLIAKIVLGQTATTEIGPWKGTADVHKSVRDEIVKSDADLLCESLNATIVRWLTQWNYPGAKVPKVWRNTAQAEDLDQVVGRMEKLSAMTGRRLSKEYVTRTFGGEWEEASDNTPPLAFAEGVTGLDEADEWEPLMAPSMNRIEAVARDTKDLEELRRRLGEIVEQADIEALVEDLSRRGFFTHLTGQAGQEIDG